MFIKMNMKHVLSKYGRLALCYTFKKTNKIMFIIKLLQFEKSRKYICEKCKKINMYAEVIFLKHVIILITCRIIK